MTAMTLGEPRISHRWIYCVAANIRPGCVTLCQPSVDVTLHEYDCWGLGRKPCQDGFCGASLRQAMRNPG